MPISNPHLDESAHEIEAATRWSRLAARFLGILIAQIWLLVTRAQTIGKKAMDIYIMRTDGAIPHIG